MAVDDAAHRLAQTALENDTPDQATWAARKGLAATGACEQCYRNLMHATIAEGNQVAFEAVFAELLAVVDADEGPDASSFLDPETIELYERESAGVRRGEFRSFPCEIATQNEIRMFPGLPDPGRVIRSDS